MMRVGRGLVVAALSTWTAACGNGDGPADGSVPGPEMVMVPAGDFEMGCDSAVVSDCLPDEVPVHTITLSAFEIDRTEVTQSQYKECVDALMCGLPGGDWFPETRGDQPVHYVAWMDAERYCTFRGKRLPTEAEWEKAARGTDGRLYPWGSQPPPDCTHANIGACPDFDTHVVATHPAGAGPYGAEDIAGNVFEWVSDWYQDDYYLASPTTDPSGPATGTFQVVRGSCYLSNFDASNDQVRVSRRTIETGAGACGVGVRCARDAT